jgi:uncharacterized HAD superfamily protein
MQQNKMKIGVDIDDTLFDFVGSFIDYSKKINNIDLKREDFTTYSFNEVLKLPSMREAIRIVFEFYDTDFFRKMPPLPGSVDTINKIKEDHGLYIITFRPDYLYNSTMNQLWNNFRNIFSDVLFSSNHYTGAKNSGKSKAEICLNYGISTMIDDSLEYALQCADKGLDVILMNAPWNQNGEHKGITRVNNWKEVLEKLEIRK